MPATLQRRSVEVLLALLLVGCGAGSESGTVSVSGKIMLDGAPLADAAVAFIGNGGARLASAQTDAEGKFAIRASQGKNQITVAKASPPSAVPEGDGLMPTDADFAKIAPPVAAGVPEKYADPKTSGLTIDVVDGMTDIELSLSSK